MYKLSFFVPETNVNVVKEKLFAAGAGKIGNYDQCCWQTLGTGQFRPLSGSTPHIGKMDSVETVPELKVEMVLGSNNVAEVLQALLDSHPYETPAYDVQPILTIEDFVN